MTKDLRREIDDAVKDRGTWERKQSMFYRMRNGGLRRTSLPYPGAPDLHFPLSDSLIEKLKPMYIQQLYSAETIAAFVCIREQDNDETAAASYWFDYNLKQRSNFERTMFVAVDEMLQDGFCPIKVYWDKNCKRLAFDQVDPLHLIVPRGTQEINQGGGADWVVHVMHLSEAEYRANPLYKQDDDYIKSIKGKGTRDAGDNDKSHAVELKEGINFSNNPDEIVLWELYNRDRKNKTITVETISPLRPMDDDKGPVRTAFGLPYNKGVFKSGECFPFFKIRSELKSKGHYSPRGVVEINAAFEASLTKSWNTLHEWMDFFTKPTFSSTQPIPNANNYKTRPGGILPPGLTPNEAPAAPTSLREDMEFTRALAEYRTQMPDLGASQHLTDRGAGGKVTATQINAIVGQSGQGNDMRARVIRLDIGEGLNMAWSIYLQYAVSAVDATGQPDKASLTYIVDNEIRNVSPDVIHEDYEITPNGSADGWNKGAVTQKRMSYFQILQGNPFVNQGELTKWVLEGDDPRMVKRLYRDQGLHEQDEQKQQAIEIALMLIGYPPQVNQWDDDKVHLKELSDFITRRLSLKESISAEDARQFLQHGGAHSQALHQKKDPLASQIDAQLKPLVMLLGQIAQSDQPGNVVPMQAAGGNGQVPPATTNALGAPAPAPPQDESDRVSDATKIGNMIIGAAKAGIPISELLPDFNKVLVELNMPPIQQPVIPQQQTA